ncbi:MAG TPA: hypothetical protein ENO09_09470 [bacterium]|nr:hypothetical protein [bacterium]
MRTKPTDQPIQTDIMQRLLLLLLTLASLPSFSDELRIDPARLQEQVQQRSEQAAQQGAAPSAPAEWLVAPTQAHSATSHGAMGQNGMGHGAGMQRSQGYGQGYERRYGQTGDRAETGSAASRGGMGQGNGRSGR